MPLARIHHPGGRVDKAIGAAQVDGNTDQLMKATLALIILAGFLGGTAWAGPEGVLKRARETRDQNNVRQDVAPARPPTPPTPARQSAAPAPSGPLQQSLARVRADLAAIQANSPVTVTQKQQLAKDLLACAQGASKPSAATVAALADSLVSALAQKPLPEASRQRLVSDLAAVLNPANLPPAQMQAIYNDIQAIFQANGLPRAEAVKLADQARAIAAETRR